MTTVNDVIHTETLPKHYHAIYPFAVTLHVSGAHPLTIAEKAVIHDAIVNAAAKIREMRGYGECNFARCEGEKIDWKREGFAQPTETQPTEQ